MLSKHLTLSALRRIPFRPHNFRYLTFAAILTFASFTNALAQGNYSIWGELRINSTGNDPNAPNGAVITLHKSGTGEIARQSISSGGRYRFTNLSDGDYDVVCEVDGREMARIRMNILPGALAPFYGYRQDFEFEWKPGSTGKPKAVSVADIYPRSSANQSLFHKAQEATEKKNYEDATRFLREILATDKADFQVWSLLGTIYFMQDKLDDAEKAYLQALILKPELPKTLLYLGKLRTAQKRFDEAIDPLTKALEAQKDSGEINLLLGEAYLQIKKGSKAVPYLNDAAKLGKPEAHLRLAWLYNAAGLKDKAVIEYEEFLKKRPDYAERKQLEEYVHTNKKQ